jgi:hypothetical protein
MTLKSCVGGTFHICYAIEISIKLSTVDNADCARCASARANAKKPNDAQGFSQDMTVYLNN